MTVEAYLIEILDDIQSTLECNKKPKGQRSLTWVIQSAPKPYAAFPPPQCCYTQNLIKIDQLSSEIFKFKSVKFSSLKGK